MGAGPELILVDTNVFVIDLRYRRDPLYGANRRFLAEIGRAQRGFTTLVNLLELCGILSFNLNPGQLQGLWTHFTARYHLSVLPAPELDAPFPAVDLRRLFRILERRASLGDALMVAVAQQHLPFATTLVTWDKDHLQGIFEGEVQTPEEWIAARA